MDFDRLYKNVSEKYKNDFLFELLSKNSELRNKFLENANVEIQDDNLSFSEFENNITSDYNYYKNKFENLNLEDFDWEDYTPRHSGYIAEWEATQHMSEDLVDEIFYSVNDNIIENILKGDLENVLSELIAIRIVIEDVEINDPYDNLGGNNYYLHSAYKEFKKSAIDKISKSRLSSQKLSTTISLVFKYFNNKKQDESKIKYFEDLLIALLIKIEDSSLINPVNKLTNINDEYFPRFALKIEELIGNKSTWLKSALKNIIKNKEIGEQVLNYYLETNFEDYLKTAKNLFEHNKKYWASIIAKNVKLTDDKNFYKILQLELCIQNNNIENYNNIKDILSDEEKDSLHQKLNYAHVYRVRIYETEKQFDNIKEIVKRNIDSRNFNELIEPILNVFPDYCFKVIEKKSFKAIAGERGRSIYSTIASWLVQAKKIKIQQAQTNKLIHELYNHKPNLPALKDEFRITGLV